MSKIVYKYGTGQEIPEDGKYLCTQVETLKENKLDGGFTRNLFVWHYYELPLPRPASPEKKPAASNGGSE